jgi:hypothetical protein
VAWCIADPPGLVLSDVMDLVNVHGLPPKLRTRVKAVVWNSLPSLLIADLRSGDV